MRIIICIIANIESVRTEGRTIFGNKLLAVNIRYGDSNIKWDEASSLKLVGWHQVSRRLPRGGRSLLHLIPCVTASTLNHTVALLCVWLQHAASSPPTTEQDTLKNAGMEEVQ